MKDRDYVVRSLYFFLDKLFNLLIIAKTNHPI